MASMIDKVMAKTNDENMESIEDCITETCLNYQEMGQLFTELLSYYGGKFDDKAASLLEDMMREYIQDTM